MGVNGAKGPARCGHGAMVSEMPGHASIAITLDTYTHILPTMHASAAAAIDAMFDAMDSAVSA